MIDLHEIDAAIDEIRREGKSIQAVERLAILYTARDYMQRETEQNERRMQPVTSPDEEVSEFRAACMGISFERIIDVLDEHMEAIKLIYPKEHDAIIRKIRSKS